MVAGVHSCSPAVPQKDMVSFVNNDDILIPELGDLTEIVVKNKQLQIKQNKIIL